MAEFKLNQRVDCKDTCDKWLDAKVVDLKHTPQGQLEVKVSYTGYSSKYDEWLRDKDYDRIQKQFTPNSSYNSLLVNNRIDVLDLEKNRWREARVIAVNKGSTEIESIHIHYKGLSAKFDEKLIRADFPLRLKSVQEGYSAKKMKGNSTLKKETKDAGLHKVTTMVDNLNISDDHDSKGAEDEEGKSKEEQALERKIKEEQFRVDMKSVDLQIVEVGTDGNCLFRSFAL